MLTLREPSFAASAGPQTMLRTCSLTAGHGLFAFQCRPHPDRARAHHAEQHDLRGRANPVAGGFYADASSPPSHCKAAPVQARLAAVSSRLHLAISVQRESRRCAASWLGSHSPASPVLLLAPFYAWLAGMVARRTIRMAVPYWLSGCITASVLLMTYPFQTLCEESREE